MAAVVAIGGAIWVARRAATAIRMTRRRPASRRISRPQWAISIAAALAVIGFVGAAQWNSSLARQEFVTSAQRVLITEAEQLQRQQETLRAEIEEAEDRVRDVPGALPRARGASSRRSTRRSPSRGWPPGWTRSAGRAW